jgi:SAM-dependent methyltransferase
MDENEIVASERRRQRLKPTAIDDVVPRISELIGEQDPVLAYVDLDGIEQRLHYRDVAAADPFPIPMPVDREGYGSVATSDRYWATGRADLLNLQQAIGRYGDRGEYRKLLDFGCATGRFLRHALLYGNFECWGADFAPANVNWMKRHLPDGLHLIENTAEPPLNLPDHCFDVVTAFSVLTHVDRNSLEWLGELCRLTRPGGLLYVTIQNEATWEKVIDRPGSLEHLMKANAIAGNLKVDADLFRGPMPQERIVFQMSNEDVYNCNVWESSHHIRATWSASAEILQIAPNAHSSYQSVVIMRAKKHGAVN